MSVRHIDYFKLSSAKFLPVEIRPIRCLLDTPNGVIRTAKWMTHEHWKELRVMISEIAVDYEEEKRLNKVTQDVKCNDHKLINGNLLKIGYMFVPYSSCRCYFLVPRDDATWTDDEDDEDNSQELRDKGGRYSSVSPSGEMLVVSVRLQEQKPVSSKRAQGPMSPMTADKQLVKALDRSFVVTNTISDYFVSSQKDSQQFNSLHSSLPPLSSPDNSSSDRRLALKNIVGKSSQRVHKRESDSESSENKKPRRRQVKSLFDTSEESVIDDDSVILNYRFINDKLPIVHRKEANIKTEKNLCEGEKITAGEGLVKTEVPEPPFYLKHEDSDVKSEEWIESGDFDSVPQDTEVASNLNNTDWSYADSAVASQLYVTENLSGDHNFFKQPTGFDLETRDAQNSDNSQLADDALFIDRIKEEPDDCMESYNKVNNDEKQSAITPVRENFEVDFYLNDNLEGSDSVPESQEYCSSSSIEPRYTCHAKVSHPEFDEEITRRYKIKMNHMSSSSSQVTNHVRNVRKDLDEDYPGGKGIRQEKEVPVHDTSCFSDNPFPVKIPRDFLCCASSSVEKMLSPRKNKGKTSQNKYHELFGESEASNDYLERNVKMMEGGNCDNQEEEYVPQPVGNLTSLNNSGTTISDYSLSSVDQTSERLSEKMSSLKTGVVLGCRRSKRLQSRDQNVCSNTEKPCDTSSASPSPQVTMLSKYKSRNEHKKSNENIGGTSPSKRTCSSVKDVNKIKKHDGSDSDGGGSEDECDFKHKCKNKKSVKICKQSEKNVKQSGKEKRNYQKILNESKLLGSKDSCQGHDFGSELCKSRSQKSGGRKRPLLEKKKKREKLQNAKPRPTSSRGRRQNSRSSAAASQKSKMMREDRNIIQEAEKDIEASRKLLSKNPYLDSDSDTSSQCDAFSKPKTKNKSSRKKCNKVKKKYKPPSDQPTLKDCFLVKSLMLKKDKQRPSEADMFADLSVGSELKETSASVSTSDNVCDGQSSFKIMSLKDLIRDMEKEKQFIHPYCETQNDFDTLPDLTDLTNLRDDGPPKSHSASMKERTQCASNEKQNFYRDTNEDSSVLFVEETNQKPSQAVIESCHTKICNMSWKELTNRLEENGDFFCSIIEGRQPNHLHQTFKKNSCRNEFSEAIFGPFSEQQIDSTHNYFKENYTGQLVQAKCHDIGNYIWRVLCPSFFIKLVMDLEDVDEETSAKMLQQMPLSPH